MTRIKLKADDITDAYGWEEPYKGESLHISLRKGITPEQLKNQILEDFNTGKFLDRYGVKGLEQFKELQKYKQFAESVKEKLHKLETNPDMIDCDGSLNARISILKQLIEGLEK